MRMRSNLMIWSDFDRIMYHPVRKHSGRASKVIGFGRRRNTAEGLAFPAGSAAPS
jgi:hypothetical protein